MESCNREINILKNRNSDIFTKIYKYNVWGGEENVFYSGSGSHNDSIPGYAKAVADFIKSQGIQQIVEIGCGDFHVAGEILKELDDIQLDYKYIGYDVVLELIHYNQKMHGTNKIRFERRDPCTDQIELGDLLIIRQVLQHLDNESIQLIIEKFKNYKFIIFTEHQENKESRELFVPNRNKSTDASIRINSCYSAVYLELPPFNCKINQMFYAIPENVKVGDRLIQASINSYLIINE